MVAIVWLPLFLFSNANPLATNLNNVEEIQIYLDVRVASASYTLYRATPSLKLGALDTRW